MPHAGLTIKAAQKVYTLMQEEDNIDLKLRVYIQGGGCSGFQYGFSFESEVAADDAVVPTMWWGERPDLLEEQIYEVRTAYHMLSTLLSSPWEGGYAYQYAVVHVLIDLILAPSYAQQHSVSLLVDSISHQYLEGARIDYKTGVEGEFFSVDNPNAKTTCGCGSSFSV